MQSSARLTGRRPRGLLNASGGENVSVDKEPSQHIPRKDTTLFSLKQFSLKNALTEQLRVVEGTFSVFPSSVRSPCETHKGQTCPKDAHLHAFNTQLSISDVSFMRTLSKLSACSKCDQRSVSFVLLTDMRVWDSEMCVVRY